MTISEGHNEARALSIARSSRLVGVLDRMLVSVIAAWRDSFAGMLSRQVIDRVTEGTVPDRLRLAGVLTAAASATALAMQRLASRPAPLTWIVPALFLFVGVC